LQQARLSRALQSGQFEANKTKKPDSYIHTPKEQIVGELMMEYFKVAFGKTSLVGEKVVLGVN
jgi:uncharacterized protein (DUF952 family)